MFLIVVLASWMRSRTDRSMFSEDDENAMKTKRMEVLDFNPVTGGLEVLDEILTMFDWKLFVDGAQP